MSKGWNLLFVVALGICTACGGGGGGGASANANPGIYEGAYSRGGGSIVIDVSATGPINAILTDESGDTYVGTLTENRTMGSIDITGTLHNTKTPSKILSINSSLSIGSTITINGQITGEFSVSFGAVKVADANNLTISSVTAPYTGTYVTQQGSQQIDAGTIDAVVTGPGEFCGKATSTTTPGQIRFFSSALGNGGGFVGLVTSPDEQTLQPFFGTASKTSNGITVNFTNPGSSPTQPATGTLTLTKFAPSPTNPFAGTFTGSAFSPTGPSISSLHVTVKADGTLSVTSTDTISGTTSTVSGFTSSDGKIVAVNGSGLFVDGSWAFNTSNQLAGSVSFADFNPPTVFRLTKSNQPLQFVGAWGGPFTEGSTTGNITVIVSTNGSVSGTETPTGGSPITFSGSVDATGNLTLTGPFGTSHGGVALTPQHLEMIISITPKILHAELDPGDPPGP